MNIIHDTLNLKDDSVESIDFYYDFIAFLRRLHDLPIKRTPAGNISMKNIQPLLKELKTTRERVDEYNKFCWKIRNEQELQTLEQIKILAEVMRLTFKRKGKLYLSKKGLGFLKNLKPIQQYMEMILHYWYCVNWDYFSFGKRIKGSTLNDILQDNQDKIWNFLLCKSTQWIDYKKFCLALRDYFHLEVFFTDSVFDSDKEFLIYVGHTLFRKNLLLFNCVELEENRFRSTKTGLYLYQKALYENYI